MSNPHFNGVSNELKENICLKDGTCHMKNRLESQPKSSYLQSIRFFDTCVDACDAFPILLRKNTVIKGTQSRSLKIVTTL